MGVCTLVDEEAKGKAKAKAPRELTDREKEKAERRAKMEGTRVEEVAVVVS
jgi:hypothetical protein